MDYSNFYSPSVCEEGTVKFSSWEVHFAYRDRFSDIRQRKYPRYRDPVGGMPKPVPLFVENNKSFEHADAEKRDILKLYRNDIMKIKAQYRSKVLVIYDQIPGLLSKHEKRVVFKEIKVSVVKI